MADNAVSTVSATEDKPAPFTRSYVTHTGETIVTKAPAYYGRVVGSVIRGLINKRLRGQLDSVPEVCIRTVDGNSHPRLRIQFHLCDIDLLGVIKVVVLPHGFPNHPMFRETYYFSSDPSEISVPDPDRRIIGLIIGYETRSSRTRIENTHLGIYRTYADGILVDEGKLAKAS